MIARKNTVPEAGTGSNAGVAMGTARISVRCVSEIIEWYDRDETRRVVDRDFNKLNDTLVERMAQVSA